MIEPELHNWVWCDHCLEWKDTDEVSFIERKEDVYGKDLLTFTCDACGRDTIGSIIISSVSKPKGG